MFRFLIPILLFVTESTFAIKFDHIVAFGDSYTDNGNGAFNISNGHFPPPPYFEGRFSDGPVWVEYLSKQLDTPLTDRAVGGATTNSMAVPSTTGINDEIAVTGIRQQITEFMVDEHNNGFSISGDRKDKKNAKTNLFVVSTFGSDYIYSIRHELKVAKPERVVGDLMSGLQTLNIEFGATNYMVNTLPKLSNFPGFSKSNASEIKFLTKLVEYHNELLKKALVSFKEDFKKANVFLLDIEKFFQKFGTEEFKESCLTIDRSGPHACDDPDKYLFWDNLHVTTRIHEMLASEASTCTQSNPSDTEPFKVC